LQYVALSKRFAPEAVNFLGGILFLASKKESPTRKYQPTSFCFSVEHYSVVGEIFASFICVDNIAVQLQAEAVEHCMASPFSSLTD